MCGIVGMIGEINLIREKMFKDMLFIDTIRGHHSTGIMRRVKSSKTTEVIKGVGTPWDLAETRSWTSFFTPLSDILIGHNRAATKGGVTRRNAHPFEFENIIGVHNGTLRRQSLLPDSDSFAVDSENIFHAIQEEGIVAISEKLHGAFALVWYDDRVETINFFRNDERPLCYGYSEDEQTMFFASEEDIIRYAARRQGVKLHMYSNGDIFTFSDEGIVYSLKAPKGSVEKLPEMEEQKVNFFIPPILPPIAPFTRAIGFNKTNGYKGARINGASNVYNDPSVITILDHNYTYISEDEFDSRTGGCCAQCSGDIDFTDSIFWIDYSTIVCEDCRDAVIFPILSKSAYIN